MLAPYTFVIILEFFLAIRLRNKKVIASKTYLGLVLILLSANLIDWLFALKFITNQKIILLSAVWTSTLASTAILLLVLLHISKEAKFKLFWVIPSLLDVLYSVWTIIPMNINLLGENALIKNKLPFNIWAWHFIHENIVKSILLIAIIIIIRNLLTKGYYKSPAFFIGIAALIPFASGSEGNELIQHNSSFQATIFVISALIIGLALSVLGNSQLFFSKNYIIDNLQDGWILIDSKKKIIDLNASAEKLLRSSYKNLYQKNAITTLGHLPAISTALRQNQEAEVHISLSSFEKPVYLHIRLLHINNKNAQPGYLLILRDDMKRRKLDIARQEARDEMFSLLHSIAGAASHSENLNEFINAVMYQMSYTFRSTSTIVFLSEKPLAQSRLLLIGQIGIKNEHLKEISFLEQDLDFITHILSSRATLLINEKWRNIYIPKRLLSVFKGEILVVPIFNEYLLAGILIMTKKNDLFQKDEVARIEIAVQEIASFIHNDRRRHAASTLAERQRLIRDLHDSVTQRLYSLVMMTEAARLEFSTQENSNTARFIKEFGFSTRQALKEMRLFLYKMQPVDLRGGFVNILMDRLDAVEGKAGLEIDITVDQNITLPAENEVHLYMIAQEILNNIIKHANASKIGVNYQKVDKFISLEIRDNGIGFLPNEIRPSGLGLRSIAERVEIIEGKLKLISTPGKGTSLTVIIPDTT